MGCLHPVKNGERKQLTNAPYDHFQPDTLVVILSQDHPVHTTNTTCGNALKVMVKMNFEHLFDVVGFSSETQNNTVLFFVAYLKSNSLYKLIRSFLP